MVHLSAFIDLQSVFARIDDFVQSFSSDAGNTIKAKVCDAVVWKVYECIETLISYLFCIRDIDEIELLHRNLFRLIVIHI